MENCAEPITPTMPRNVTIPLLTTRSGHPLESRSSQQTTLSIGSPSHLTIPSRNPGWIHTANPHPWLRKPKRACVYICVYIAMALRIGTRHKLLPGSAGASFSSLPKILNRERCGPATLLNSNKRQAMPGLVCFNCQAGGTPPFFACNSLRETHTPFDVFDFFIPWHTIHRRQLVPMTS